MNVGKKEERWSTRLKIGNDEEWVGTVDVNITFETENRSEVKK